MWGVLDPPVSTFSLSLYRHPSIYILFTSHFTSYNKHSCWDSFPPLISRSIYLSLYHLIINKHPLDFTLSFVINYYYSSGLIHTVFCFTDQISGPFPLTNFSPPIDFPLLRHRVCPCPGPSSVSETFTSNFKSQSLTTPTRNILRWSGLLVTLDFWTKSSCWKHPLWI